MFEPPQSKEKAGGAGLYIAIVVVIIVVGGGAWFYLNSKSPATTPDSTPAAGAAVQANADPVHDLRVVSAKMAKDYTGTTAVWTVEIKNQSSTFTYTNIGYEATYARGDNATLADNHGTIPNFTLGPGESQQTEFKDTGYPAGTALYIFKVSGASASK